MPLLGRAIAPHLSSLKGLYSVELPLVLEQDMLDLVAKCHAVAPARAVLVGQHFNVPAGITQVSWPDVLGWRATEDRVFVWRRGEPDPDTSFRDVVRPFISSRFPGTSGGECSTEELPNLCLDELCRSLTLQPGGQPFEAFKNTAATAADAL